MTTYDSASDAHENFVGGADSGAFDDMGRVIDPIPASELVNQWDPISLGDSGGVEPADRESLRALSDPANYRDDRYFRAALRAERDRDEGMESDF